MDETISQRNKTTPVVSPTPIHIPHIYINGICHVLAITITGKDLSIEIHPQELIPFEYYNLPGEDLDEYFLNENLKFERGKIEEVIDKLQLDHLNQEEKEHVVETVREFPDSFYLPGEPLTSTHLVQPKIFKI